jgi:phage terminase small subunit
MGRPRKNPHERRLEGNPGKRPIPFEVFSPEGVAFVPEELSDAAQGCAEHILQCFKVKRLTGADSYALAAFATHWTQFLAAVHAMNVPSFEPMVEGSTGQKVPNPWFKVLNEQSREMRAWATKLYLTPADRSSLPASGEQAKSKFDGLRGQSGSSATLNS